MPWLEQSYMGRKAVVRHAALPGIEDQVIPVRLIAFGDPDQFLDMLAALVDDRILAWIKWAS